jgi:branched-chain amino acid transport system ATP-binding protein
VRGLVKRFRGVVAVAGADFDLRPGELHALIGPNGAGKTTLINLLAGELRADAGTIVLDGADISGMPAHRRALMGLVRSYQVTSLFPDFSALQNVMLAVQARSGHSFSFLRDARLEARLIEPARSALVRVGLGDKLHENAAALAHGDRRQLELAMVLAMQSKVMLLDEPLAGMSGHEADAMVAFLRKLKGSCGIVLVEHDMDAVFALADRITVLVSGRPVASGTPDEVRASEEVRKAYFGDAEDLE